MLLVRWAGPSTIASSERLSESKSHPQSNQSAGRRALRCAYLPHLLPASTHLDTVLVFSPAFVRFGLNSGLLPTKGRPPNRKHARHNNSIRMHSACHFSLFPV